MSDVVLTSSMRNNLMALRANEKLLSQTQERLSTGKKVNSALDNPTSYFAAKSHMSRANDLMSLKDGMSEAIQIVKSADEGITSMIDLLETAKGIATAAKSEKAPERADLAQQFDDIMAQIDTIALDSNYKGTNLLDSESITVDFNEDASSQLTVTGFDGSTTGQGITSAVADNNAWADKNADIQASLDEVNAAITSLRTEASSLASNMSVVTTRQDYTEEMINVLQVGADNLVLADMNEESANMLALETRQALGITSLNLSSRAAQSILQLF